MKKVVFSFFFIFLFLIQCDQKRIKNIGCHRIILTVFINNEESYPLNIFVDLKNHDVLLFSTSFLELIPQPKLDLIKPSVISSSKKLFMTEYIKLTTEDVNLLKLKLSKFSMVKVKDYSSNILMKDGIVVRSHLILNDGYYKLNSYDNLDESQMDFFIELKKIILKRTGQVELIERYFEE